MALAGECIHDRRIGARVNFRQRTLAVNSRSSDRCLDRQTEVEDIHQTLHQSRDDPSPTGRTDCQERLAVTQDEGWRWRPQRPLTRRNRIHSAWLWIEPGHAVVQDNTRAPGDHPRPEQLAERRRTRHHISLAVYDIDV